MTALPKLAQTDGGPAHSFDVLNYKLNVDIYASFISPYPHTFRGDELVTFRVDSALSAIALDANSSSLIIDSVGLAGAGFSHTGGVLTVNLDHPYGAGDTVTIAIHYRHLDVVDGSYNVFSGLVFTDCEPEGARKWFPCWDKPSDKATLDLTAIVPSSARLGSNGRLADSSTSNDTTVYHWISRDPIATYLMVMTARTGYNLDIVQWPLLSNPTVSIPILFYWNTGETAAWLQNIETIIVPMMTRYSQLFGEHPFEKNGFATIFQGFFWGGMENQTLTSLCHNCWEEGLVSHEFAHQWFGDMITCGTWADIWLNEGFATYCEALWLESTGGPPAYKSSIVDNATYYLAANPGWAIYNASWVTSTPSINVLFNTAITYSKGACVLHMLRYTIGDSLFFAAMKTYGTNPAYKYKSAVTADFVSTVNQVAGQDLSWFFTQWVQQPNHPVYHNTYSISPVGGGAWSVNFIASQVQSNPAFFKMPVELTVQFASGPDTLVQVMNDANNQSFVFTFDRQPTAVIFDPSNQLVLKTATTTLVGVPGTAEIPLRFELLQNYPNPFNLTTVVRYQLPVASNVRLDVYDILGRLVRTLVQEVKPAGSYQVIWNASEAASGVYVYRLTAGRSRQSRSMILLK